MNYHCIYREYNKETDRLSKQALLGPLSGLTFYQWENGKVDLPAHKKNILIGGDCQFRVWFFWIVFRICCVKSYFVKGEMIFFVDGHFSDRFPMHSIDSSSVYGGTS